MKKVNVTWPAYHRDVKRLAKTITQHIDVIVAISRGGLVLGCQLSHVLNKPLAVVAVQSYKGKKRGQLTVGQFSSAVPLKGSVLLVDDLVDSGTTMSEVRKRLQKMPNVKNTFTAVLYWKPTSHCFPNFYARRVDGWVRFPYEK
ncbi:MAG: phosphoribosyltransferase family protein [Patescibacteria group bacterium]